MPGQVFLGPTGGYTPPVIDRKAASRGLDEVQRRMRLGADAVRGYLASPEGERLRRRVARVMIVSAPLVARSPLFRATPAGRVIRAVGGTALLVKLGETLRDWQPAMPQHHPSSSPSSPETLTRPR